MLNLNPLFEIHFDKFWRLLEAMFQLKVHVSPSLDFGNWTFNVELCSVLKEFSTGKGARLKETGNLLKAKHGFEKFGRESIGLG